ncbi:MAG: Na+/H+ antiporter NhaC [Cyclobacteriaceae bacterium]|nr:Na+/H+ antiporter NhaC [Cyclobacteriaceae bacterium]
MTEKKRPTLVHAFIPIAFLVAFLAINVIVFGPGATDGPNQIALIFSAGVAGIVSWRLGYSWEEIEVSIVKSISSAMGAMLILLVIGSLSGAWLLSGIVPAMIYYGLKILNPTIFLFAACVVCCVVSLATGSSWSTIATVGIALLGIGKTLGIHEGVVAGAIISGAYFGDKMSPLSDTTNLAPAMAGTDLFTHVKYMVYTTVPTLAITLLIFLVWGFTLDTSGTTDTANVLASIDNAFNLNPLLFIVPALVLFMIVRKVPAIPALLVGTILGGIFAVIFQPQIIQQVSGITGDPVKSAFIAVMKSFSMEVSIITENKMINGLLSSGGMAGMLNTIWLILGAMVFGGVMESCGLLKRIVEEIIKWAHSTGSLVASTAVTSIFFNLTAGDQYMAIAVPGRMFADTYRKRGYKPELLSRTLEDAGTVTSVLVPWNTCGATQSKVLGISTWAYAPYCFFCIISPLMTVLQAYLNYKIRRLDDKDPNS